MIWIYETMLLLKHTTENQMQIQIIATHIVDGRKIVITYGEEGYSDLDLSDGKSCPFSVPKEIEDSFIGASMFGWECPVADRAHEWVKENVLIALINLSTTETP